MKLVEDLTATTPKLQKTLIRRARRRLDKEQLDKIERKVKRAFGANFLKSYPPLSYSLINKYREELNTQAWKSERYFLEALIVGRVYNFWTNYPVLNRFFADVFIQDLKVVIELDGSIHEREDVKRKDERKDYLLTQFGYKVFRYKIRSKEDAVKAVGHLCKNADISQISPLYKDNSWDAKLAALYNPEPPKIPELPKVLTAKQVHIQKAKVANNKTLEAYYARQIEHQKIFKEKKKLDGVIRKVSNWKDTRRGRKMQRMIDREWKRSIEKEPK